MQPSAPSPSPTSVPPPRPGATVTRFLERVGYPVMEALGTYWFRAGQHVYWSLPPQHRFDFDPREVDALLRRRRLVGLRYPTVTAPGEPDGLYVCRTTGYSPVRLKRKRRKEVRLAEPHVQVRALDPDQLLAEGLELNLQTMARHHHFLPRYGEPAQWARFVRAIRDCPGVSTLGAFVDGRLSAYMLSCRDGAWLHPYVKMSRTDDLPRDTTSVLDYQLLVEASRDPTLEAVEAGWLRGTEHMFAYRMSLGYEPVRMSYAMHLHPALGVLTRPWGARATGALASALPRVRPLRVVAAAAQAARASRPEALN